MRFLSFWPIFTIGLLVVIGLSAWVLVSSPERLFEVNGDHLGSSLAKEHPTGRGGECVKPERRDLYACGVESRADSDFDFYYRLSYDDEGCWRARRGRVVGSDPARIAVNDRRQRFGRLSGCLGLLDFIDPSGPDGESVIDVLGVLDAR